MVDSCSAGFNLADRTWPEDQSRTSCVTSRAPFPIPVT